ncbi:MAG: hypothetical protein POELPBGB_00331 [Bacteroidia bacterium]|nr:hypothetical protein [Bacteroidia bacterium]
MPKREYILRYTSIIKRLKKSEATFDEISDYLQRESEFQGYEFAISKRTFQRDVEDIRSMYGVDIQYDFSRKVYRIAEDEREEENSRMLEAFDMYNTLNKSESFADYIHFEKRKPQGTEHFYGLLHAIKNKLMVRFVYRKFWEDEESNRSAEPLALKEFKGRWYLIAKDKKDNLVKSFGLDRIHELELTKAKFKPDAALNIAERFRNSFGVINPPDEKPQKIVLSFSTFQAKYIKSYPLHSSQKVISETKDECRIELYLLVTHDFVMELLSFGSEVEVLEPKSLRREIAKELKEALGYYQ